MTTVTLAFNHRRIACYYRPLLLVIVATVLFGVFWFTSRYPQLLVKADHVGGAIASMAYGGELIHVAADAALWEKILYGAVNWLDGMKIGMTFGVLLGALLHTTLRYYPLKIGKNLYLNSLKGALIGVPAAVCANCSVPVICGVTRGHGRVEVALGFLFSSPNFNPVVVVMTFVALPLSMSLMKYAILLFVIIVLVPVLIARLERDEPLSILTTTAEGAVCEMPLALGTLECTESFWSVSKEMGNDYLKNVWMLARPTLTLMLLASLVAAALLTLIPWQSLLSEVTPWRIFLLSAISAFMPVPIALDVMFAASLNSQGVAGGYVMMFLMTLGTFSIIPAIYLWRDVSRPLALSMYLFFWAIGCITGLVFLLPITGG